MVAVKNAGGTVLRVVDSMSGAHGGQILRFKVHTGEPPRVRQIRGATLVARSPEGREVLVKVVGFALFGGRPSDDRIARTGMVDLSVEGVEGSDPSEIGIRWTTELGS